MGRSKQIGKATKHNLKRKLKVKTATKEKAYDEIHDDLKPERRVALLNQNVDHDLPGKGQHYCLTCGKYFQNDASLTSHMKSRPHKRRYTNRTTRQSNKEEEEGGEEEDGDSSDGGSSNSSSEGDDLSVEVKDMDASKHEKRVVAPAKVAALNVKASVTSSNKSSAENHAKPIVLTGEDGQFYVVSALPTEESVAMEVEVASGDGKMVHGTECIVTLPEALHNQEELVVTTCAGGSISVSESIRQIVSVASASTSAVHEEQADNAIGDQEWILTETPLTETVDEDIKRYNPIRSRKDSQKVLNLASCKWLKEPQDKMPYEDRTVNNLSNLIQAWCDNRYVCPYPGCEYFPVQARYNQKEKISLSELKESPSVWPGKADFIVEHWLGTHMAMGHEGLYRCQVPNCRYTTHQIRSLRRHYQNHKVSEEDYEEYMEISHRECAERIGPYLRYGMLKFHRPPDEKRTANCLDERGKEKPQRKPRPPPKYKMQRGEPLSEVDASKLPPDAPPFDIRFSYTKDSQSVTAETATCITREMTTLYNYVGSSMYTAVATNFKESLKDEDVAQNLETTRVGISRIRDALDHASSNIYNMQRKMGFVPSKPKFVLVPADSVDSKKDSGRKAKISQDSGLENGDDVVDITAGNDDDDDIEEHHDFEMEDNVESDNDESVSTYAGGTVDALSPGNASPSKRRKTVEGGASLQKECSSLRKQLAQMKAELAEQKQLRSKGAGGLVPKKVRAAVSEHALASARAGLQAAWDIMEKFK